MTWGREENQLSDSDDARSRLNRAVKVCRNASLLALTLVLAACAASPTAPDLERLYRTARDNPEQPPLILIPGVLGSRLEDSRGREVWPGTLWKLLSSRYPELALRIDPHTLEPVADELRPAGLFASASGREYYSRILRVLENAGGYVPGVAGEAVADGKRRYYILAYDWRQDAVKSAQALDRLIEQLRIDYGRPDLRVDVIGHSMGGLIARYYARYGTADLLNGNDFPVTQAGAQKMRRLVLVGTPNLGSVEAMHSLIEGRELGQRRTSPEVIMTMPAIYQLLPHALNDWLYTAQGKALTRDQFDAYIWKRFEMGPWSPSLGQRVRQHLPPEDAQAYLATLAAYFERQLERARRFTWALTVAESPGGIRPIIFGGDCTLTPARMVVEEVAGESVLRLWPGDIDNPVRGLDYQTLMLEPGDGTVTKASLLGRDILDPTAPRHKYLHFSPASVFFICERHELLTANITFQDNLLQALLSVD